MPSRKAGLEAGAERRSWLVPEPISEHSRLEQNESNAMKPEEGLGFLGRVIVIAFVACWFFGEWSILLAFGMGFERGFGDAGEGGVGKRVGSGCWVLDYGDRDCRRCVCSTMARRVVGSFRNRLAAVALKR